MILLTKWKIIGDIDYKNQGETMQSSIGYRAQWTSTHQLTIQDGW